MEYWMDIQYGTLNIYSEVMEYYSEFWIYIQNKRMSAKPQINLKPIMLSERGQKQTATYCMIPFIWYFGELKTKGTENQSVVARDSRGKTEEINYTSGTKELFKT